MLFMVVEHYKAGAAVVYERFRDRGRMAPDNVRYVASWVAADLTTCYQVMDAADEKSLEPWLSAWRDIVDFEVIPVMTSAEAAAVHGR